MKKEEKLLVIKDLCARLPYGVIVKHGRTISVLSVNIMFDIIADGTIPKPYLRPMSSMTQEEIKKYHQLCETDDGDFTGEVLYFNTCESFDYLNSIHVDYRNFIQRGLALEAPKEMYNI